MNDVQGWTDYPEKDFGIAPPPELGDEWIAAAQRGIPIRITTGCSDLVLGGFNTAGGIEGVLKRAEECHMRHDLVGAILAYDDVIRVNPMDDRAWAGKGTLSLENAHLSDPDGRNIPAAIAMLKRAIAIEPKNFMAQANLAGALHQSGRLAEALAAMRNAAELFPDEVVPVTSYLFALQSSPDHDEHFIKAETERLWGGLSKRLVPNPFTSWGNNRNPDRSLRVAYMSSDFDGSHPITRFMEPILKNHTVAVEIIIIHLHYDKSVTIADGKYTTILHRVTDEALALAIHQRHIDVLVDLNGFTSRGRPLVLAWRPCPVSISHLSSAGDPGLCGFFLTDEFLTPNDDPRALYLPSFWLYSPHPQAPADGPLPALRKGFATFGSLNSFSKVNDQCLEAWRRILEAVPSSKMIIHAPSPMDRKRVLAALGECGEKVEFVARQVIGDYFATFNRIDIHLDTFPYGGGTTTFDALWMGLPVVTLDGNKAVARAGKSIISTMWHGTKIPKSMDEYVHLAATWARLATSKNDREWTTRHDLLQSPLMDAKSHVAALEGCYRSAWSNWCMAQKD